MFLKVKQNAFSEIYTRFNKVSLKTNLADIVCNNIENSFVFVTFGTMGRYFRNFWVRMFRWDPGTLEPLAYSKANSAEFCYPTLQ